MTRNTVRIMVFAPAIALLLGAAAPTGISVESASVEERAVQCMHWPENVGRSLSAGFRSNFDSTGASVAFAHSIGRGTKVSVQLHDSGCQSEPVIVAEVLPLEKRRGAVTIDQARRNGNRATMYGLIELPPELGSDVQTYLLVEKSVTAVEIDLNVNPA